MHSAKTLQVLHAEGRIFRYNRFLSDKECEHIISLAGEALRYWVQRGGAAAAV